MSDKIFKIIITKICMLEKQEFATNRESKRERECKKEQFINIFEKEKKITIVTWISLRARRQLEGK